MKLRAKASHSGFDILVGHDWSRKDSPSGGMDQDYKIKHLRAFHNHRHPDNPIPDELPLGSGVYGMVMRTKNGVIKFDRSATEAKFYAKLPKYLLAHPIIAKSVKTGSVRVPKSWRRSWDTQEGQKLKLSTIQREDILHLDHGSETARALGDINAEFNCAMGGWYNLTSSECRQMLYAIIRKWVSKNQTNFKLKDDEKKKLKQFAGGLMRLIRFGIVPRDMHDYNIGRRADGTFVLRDVGIYDVMNDTLKPHPNCTNSQMRSPVKSRHNIAKSTSKLRITRRTPELAEVCA